MPAMDTETKPAFERILGIPRGHVLRQVRCAPRGGGGRWVWEHEEYDAQGALVAIYESVTRGRAVPPVRGADDASFVKYSPWGWVLSRSGPGPGRRPGSDLGFLDPPRTRPAWPDDRSG